MSRRSMQYTAQAPREVRSATPRTLCDSEADMLRRALQGGPQSVPSMLRTLDCTLGFLLGTLAVGVLSGYVVRNGVRTDSETGEEIPYYALSDSVAE